MTLNILSRKEKTDPTQEEESKQKIPLFLELLMAMPQCDRNQTSVYLNRRGLNSFFTAPIYLTGREIFHTGREPPYLGSFINSISK